MPYAHTKSWIYMFFNLIENGIWRASENNSFNSGFGPQVLALPHHYVSLIESYKFPEFTEVQAGFYPGQECREEVINMP